MKHGEKNMMQRLDFTLNCKHFNTHTALDARKCQDNM